MKNVIQGTTLSGTGAVSIAPGAEITIRNPAGQLVPLWADRAGTQPHDNPFLTDSEGQFRVYADSGWVHVRAQKDGSVREWRYVPIGSAAAMDIGEVYAALGSEIYSSVSEGLSNSAEGDYFLVESSGSLDLYRVVNGVAEQRELGIEADAILATRAYADGVAAEAESNATNAAVAAAGAAYQQATEYSDSQLQTHRESDDHDGRYYTKAEVDQALSTKVDDDDPRLSDAREWTAETVSQAEAEAGTGTTRRAWTAQRVRQAIVAAYNALTSAFGRTLANASDAAAARNTLGLGTAATRDVGTGANNVVVGSDTRLSDAREWIAPMVTQAEVEGGESTEPRKWSVEMVKLAAEIYGGSGSGDTGLPSPIVPDTFLQAKADGSGYEAKTAGQVAEVVGPLIQPASQTEAGIVRLADAAAARGLTDALRVLTPGTLAEAFKGGNQTLSNSGYQKLPGGLILQWARVIIPSVDVGAQFQFPIAFPSACFVAVPVGVNTDPDGSSIKDPVIQVSSISATTVSLRASITVSGQGNTDGVYYIAVGA